MFKRRIVIATLLVGSLQIANAETQPWIVGGDLVPAGQRRAVASVEIGAGGFCTGVLVAPDLVLTARHCLRDPEGNLVDAKAVVIGSNKRFETDVAGSERIVVSRSIRHPTEDLGLLVLERASTITPIPVMQGCALPFLANGVTATVAGFGAHNSCGTALDPYLRQASLIVNDVRCDTCPPDYDRGMYLTAKSDRGASGCFGDSGGPFILNTAAGEFVIGIVHGGPETEDGIPCASTNAFVRPDAFVDWIETQSGRTLQEPTCSSQLALPSSPHKESPIAVANTVGPSPIVNGYPAPFGKYPAVTLVAYEFGFCSGVLVAPDIVLTAGHCIEENDTPKAIVGAMKVMGTDGESIEVTRKFRHPELDIGVLVLARASTAEFAKVADECVEDKLVTGADVMMVGFGLNNRCGFGWDFDGMLREGPLKIADPECQKAAENECEYPGAEILASDESINGCMGDSGGPLFLESGEHLFVAGITSRGANSDPLAPVCGGGGIYPRIDAINQWIERETGRTLTGACDVLEETEETTGCCSSSGGAAALPLGMMTFGFVALRRRRRK